MMDVEEKLAKLKRDYILIKPPRQLLENGWFDLRQIIDDKAQPAFIFKPVLARAIVLASLVIFILGGAFFGLVQVAQGALPGEPLYGVKRLSEDIFWTVFPDQEAQVERRAQEIVGLAQEERDANLLKEASEEYERVVLEAKGDIEKEDKKESFRQILERQEREFRHVIEKDPDSKDDLEKAIEASRKGRNGNGKVRGVQNEERPGEDERDGDKKEKEENDDEEDDKEEEERSGSNSGRD